MDDPHTTNSNNTQNETTLTQPIPKTITENEKSQTNNQIPLQAGEATHTKLFQQGYNPLTFSPVPVSSHKSIVPATPNGLHKRKLQQITPAIMEPISTKTANNYRRASNAYNTLIVHGTGKLTIEKLDVILVSLRTLGEYPIIDLTTDTVFTPDQKETTFTGNRDIKPTPEGLFGNTTRTTAPRGLFGNTTPPQAATSPAVAAKDPTRFTAEQTRARSGSQETQEYTDALRESMLDRTTVTPGTDTNTLGKKRETDNSRTRRHSLKQTKLGDIPLPTMTYYPMHKDCKSVTDPIMTTWVKAKYPLFTKEISIHCTEDDKKRKALKLIAGLIGKTFPEGTITDLLAHNKTNADQLPKLRTGRHSPGTRLRRTPALVTARSINMWIAARRQQPHV
jgi:hypothetical protein